MADPRGTLTIEVGGKEYRLFMGMSVLADLQSKHGQDVLERLEPPADAGPGWMPDLSVVHDIFLSALQRYHADEADRWLVDDLIAENAGALQSLMGSSFPDREDAPKGKPKRPKVAA